MFHWIMDAAPPSFKALMLELAGNEEDTGGGGVARELMEMVSDERFVLLLPEHRFAHVKGVACHTRTRDPIRDWGYRVSGELDAFEMADCHLAKVENMYVI